MASPLLVPSAASALARLMLITVTTFAMNISMTRPNPTPSADSRQQASKMESASNMKGVIHPLAMLFCSAPGIIEFMAVAIRLVGPPGYDIVSGTCAERIAFDDVALFGCLLCLCGTGIRLWCYQTLGKCFTFELALLPNHRLVTTGPYAIVRHPSYTGGFLALVGTTVANVAKGSWASECGALFSWWGIGWGIILGVGTIVMFDRCSREDRFLRKAFKEEWDTWSERVKWRLVPGIY